MQGEFAQDITVETILKGVEAKDIDELANALPTILISNKFDKTTEIKLDELLNFLRNES